LFTLAVSIDVIDENISYYRHSLSPLIPPSSHQRTAIVLRLAILHLYRFLLSDDERDLEISILQFTHAIFLPYHPSAVHDPNLIWTFIFLTRALFHRCCKYEQTNDVRYCLTYLRLLRNSTPNAFGVTHYKVTNLLVDALALRAKLEPDNALEGIQEMSILCRELLQVSSGLPKPDINDAIEGFSRALMTGFMTLFDQWSSTQLSWDPNLPIPSQPSQQVVECLREANMRLPDLHIVSIALFLTFSVRFVITKSNDDYEDAMASLDNIRAPHLPSDCPSPDSRNALGIAARLASRRFVFYGNQEYLEDAIYRWRTYLSSTSPEDPDRGAIIHSLVVLERRRSHEFGFKIDPPETRSSSPKVIDPHSFSHLVASLTELNAMKFPSMTQEDRIQYYEAVRAMNHITNKADIQGAAKYCRLLLTSLQRSPDDEITLSTMNRSCRFFLHAFRLTNNPEYLNESIDVSRHMLQVRRAGGLHFSVFPMLISSLLSRFFLSNNRKDFDEVMQLFPLAATDTCTRVPNRFEVSYQWAQFARCSGHSSTSTAYKNAISLMQDTLAFAPTLEMQHRRLVSMRDYVERLPSDYASYQVHTGQIKEAIETLEQGRGLLWSELRGMRTSIDQLRRVDSHLAEKFATVNRDLEALTTSGTPTFWLSDGDGDSGEKMDPLGRSVVKQRKLLDERTSLIEQIRGLPGFANLLMAPSFDFLRSAAAHGPVIIINHCHWRSDIIVLVHDSLPSLILTPDNFYDRAKALKEKLFAARTKDLDSTEYNNVLSSVLETLHDLVGRPVIKRLQELNIPEQSRIWWCPTSVFGSLPLHAMGPVRSEGALKLYFSDLYIPSYTPTLSALIESRKPGSHSSETPSILLVAQPDEFMPAAWGEISLVRHLQATVTTLSSKRATPSDVMKHLQNHRFAHFSCHGTLETGKPFDASFKLYRGGRLRLLEIIRSRLPSAEFAFLSACHTAELTEESIADEGLHLSAAVQYSGFRSVVGTMWAMADIDGQVLAKHFYGSLFSEKWQDVPYYERTAEALRDAVQELRRKKNVNMERWVNFVHYGA
jgi:CHAT domain-containing protein